MVGRGGVRDRLGGPFGVKSRLGGVRGGGVGGVRGGGVADARIKLLRKNLGRGGRPAAATSLVRTPGGIVTARRAGIGQRRGGAAASRGNGIRRLENFTVVTPSLAGPQLLRTGIVRGRGAVTGLLRTGIVRTGRGAGIAKTIRNPVGRIQLTNTIPTIQGGLMETVGNGQGRLALTRTVSNKPDLAHAANLYMTVKNDTVVAEGPRLPPSMPIKTSLSPAKAEAKRASVTGRLAPKAIPASAVKVLLSNLAASVTVEDVSELCESVGRLVAKPRLVETGVALAYFARREDAEAAVAEFHGRQLDSVIMHLQLLPSPGQDPTPTPAPPRRPAPAPQPPPPVDEAMEDPGPLHFPVHAASSSSLPPNERSKFNKLLETKRPGGPNPDRSLITTALFPTEKDKAAANAITFTVKI